MNKRTFPIGIMISLILIALTLLALILINYVHATSECCLAFGLQ